MINPSLNNLIELIYVKSNFTGVPDSPLEKGNCMKDTAIVDIFSEDIPFDLSRY